MILTEQTRTEFSAMLLKEYGIELSRRNELLPILFLMHAYEEKMGSTIATGFGFMDAAGTQLTESSLKLETLMSEVRDQSKIQQQAVLKLETLMSEVRDYFRNQQQTVSGKDTNGDAEVATWPAQDPAQKSKTPLLLLLIAVVQTLLLIVLIARG